MALGVSPKCHQKDRKKPERTENTAKDGKENYLGKSTSCQEMQVEGQVSKNRDLALSRPKRGFDSRWGHQKNRGVAISATPFPFRPRNRFETFRPLSGAAVQIQ